MRPIRFTARSRALMLAAMLLWASVPARSNPQRDSAIYVARRGWHIDVGFDAADLAPPLRGLSQSFPGATFLFFGFGDRRYLESRHRMLPAMLAALWPGKGLLLATGLTAAPEEAFGRSNVMRLSASPGQSRTAQAYIWNSLRDANSRASSVPAVTVGPYDGSLYYAARPTYSAVHTCNTWAAEVLNAAGLPVRGGGIVFAWQLWSRLQKSAAAD